MVPNPVNLPAACPDQFSFHKGIQMKKSVCVLFVCLCVFLCGCRNNMALNQKQARLDMGDKSIALMTATISNQVNPDCQMEIISTCITPKPSLKCSIWDMKLETLYNSDKPVYHPKINNEYLMSFKIKEGINTVVLMETGYSIPFLLSGGAILNIYLENQVKPNSVTYWGHLDIVLRKKKDGEKSAGIRPLIDAAIIGYSGGTFDVVVEDRFDEDMKTFKSKYPALTSTTVEKAILPQWTRPVK